MRRDKDGMVVIHNKYQEADDFKNGGNVIKNITKNPRQREEQRRRVYAYTGCRYHSYQGWGKDELLFFDGYETFRGRRDLCVLENRKFTLFH